MVKAKPMFHQQIYAGSVIVLHRPEAAEAMQERILRYIARYRLDLSAEIYDQCVIAIEKSQAPPKPRPSNPQPTMPIISLCTPPKSELEPKIIQLLTSRSAGMFNVDIAAKLDCHVRTVQKITAHLTGRGLLICTTPKLGGPRKYSLAKLPHKKSNQAAYGIATPGPAPKIIPREPLVLPPMNCARAGGDDHKRHKSLPIGMWK